MDDRARLQAELDVALDELLALRTRWQRLARFTQAMASPPADPDHQIVWLEDALMTLTDWEECEIIQRPLRHQLPLHLWKSQSEWWKKLSEKELKDAVEGVGDREFKSTTNASYVSWMTNRPDWLKRHGRTDPAASPHFRWLAFRCESNPLSTEPSRKFNNVIVARTTRDAPGVDPAVVTAFLRVAGLMIRGMMAFPGESSPFLQHLRELDHEYEVVDDLFATREAKLRTEQPSNPAWALYDRIAYFSDKFGADHAKDFQNFVRDLMNFLFEEQLHCLGTEKILHGGSKFIDIVYQNHAKEGLFHDLPQRYLIPCPYVFVECKNYKDDPKNPELDQLLGRFSPGRGRVGILACRSFSRRHDLIQRCRNAANDGTGWVLSLDLHDFRAFLQAKLLVDIGKHHDTRLLWRLLDEHFRLLAF